MSPNARRLGPDPWNSLGHPTLLYGIGAPVVDLRFGNVIIAKGARKIRKKKCQWQRVRVGWEILVKGGLGTGGTTRGADLHGHTLVTRFL